MKTESNKIKAMSHLGRRLSLSLALLGSSLLLSHCADSSTEQQRSQDKNADTDAENYVSTANAPVAVGGAFLTCAPAKSVAVDASQVGVGCEFSEEEKKIFEDKEDLEIKVIVNGVEKILTHVKSNPSLDGDNSVNILDLEKVDIADATIIISSPSAGQEVKAGIDMAELITQESQNDTLDRFQATLDYLTEKESYFLSQQSMNQSFVKIYEDTIDNLRGLETSTLDLADADGNLTPEQQSQLDNIRNQIADSERQLAETNTTLDRIQRNIDEVRSRIDKATVTRDQVLADLN